MDLPLGVGVDIISISRIRRAVERKGNRFLKRVFTDGELENCFRSGDVYSRLAGRFAAKEAVFKALGNACRGRLKWKDVEIGSGDFGGVEVRMNETLRRFLEEIGVGGIYLSLSHDRTSDVAVAVVLLVK